MVLSTVVVNRLIDNLMYTGLSEYEAKAYIALLGKNPVTAYELARASGIPTSKIYEVLSRLEEKGIVSPLGEERVKKYVPMEPAEFIATRRTMMSSTLEALSNELPTLSEGPGVSYIWNIGDHAYLMDKARRMVKEAKAAVLASLWHEEMALLADAMGEAQQRGVKIAAVHFGVVSARVGKLYQHPIHDTIYAEKGGRGLVLVADSSSALMGTIFADDHVEGAYSVNKGFVTLAEDYIKHDIYVMKLVRRFDRELVERFGQRYEKLRDVFADEENP